MGSIKAFRLYCEWMTLYHKADGDGCSDDVAELWHSASLEAASGMPPVEALLSVGYDWEQIAYAMAGVVAFALDGKAPIL